MITRNLPNPFAHNAKHRTPVASDHTQVELRSTVRRNAKLLLTTQALTTISYQMNYLVGSLAVYSITNDLALAGLLVSLTFVGRIFAPYFTGWLMDRRGRRLVLALGCVLTSAALFGLALAYLSRDVPLLLSFFLLYGVGFAILTQIRVAIADMYPASNVGSAIGYLYSASILGSLIAPLLVLAEQAFPGALNVDPYAALWIIGGVAAIPAAASILLIRVDTSEVARLMGEMDRFKLEPSGASGLHWTSGLTSPFVVSALTWGVMISMMSLLSLDMKTEGFPLYLISITITVHFAGMYAPSLAFGWTTDRFGARVVMLGSAIVTGLGGLLTTLTTDFYLITVGMFLVGVGWSGATVSSTAVITSITHVNFRGRILGLNDTLNSVAAVVCPFAGGAIIADYGFIGLGLFGLVLSIPAALFGILKREGEKTVDLQKVAPTA